jgi:hypothetical protein
MVRFQAGARGLFVFPTVQTDPEYHTDSCPVDTGVSTSNIRREVDISSVSDVIKLGGCIPSLSLKYSKSDA